MPRLTLRADDPTPDANGAAPDAGKRPPAEPAAPPLLVRRREAARLCGLSPASWDRLHVSGRCPAPVRLGGAVLWRVAELIAWTEAGCPDRETWAAIRAANNAN
ncbi:MAG TPA: hypothetical protein VH575_28345 [Gemmataceae bacterium]|jgi:predicted DNA-binding transcriptional regulator AlpA